MKPVETNPAVRALLADQAWQRILATFQDRFMSRCSVNGVHRVANEAEAIAIRGLLGGRPVKVGSRLRAAKLDAALQESALGCTLEALLHHAAPVPLVPRPVLSAQVRSAWQAACDEVIEQAERSGVGADVRRWLDDDRVQLRRSWKSRPSVFVPAVSACAGVLAIIRSGNGMPTSVPVIAERVTVHPHALNPDQPAGKLLPRLLTYLEGAPGTPSTTKARVELLRRWGIEVDEISSQVVVFGLTSGHPLATVATEHRTFTVLTLAHLRSLGPTGTHSTQIWGIENPAVFRALVNRVLESGAGALPCLVLTSGKPSLAAQLLVTRLLSDDPARMFYYSGDNDAPGHGIMRGFVARHPGRVMPWGMTVEGLGQVRPAPRTLWQEALIDHLWQNMFSIEKAGAVLGEVPVRNPGR